MPNHRLCLPKKIDTELSVPNQHIILVNALGAITTTTPIEQILQYEPFQTAGGYAPQPIVYIAGSSTYISAIGYQRFEQTITFTEGATDSFYDFTHFLRIVGRGPTANKQITLADPGVDQLTVIDHGLVDGDRVFVRSTGSLPDGLEIALYYAKVLNVDTLELHSTAALNSKVDFTDTGIGALWLQYASGTIYGFDTTVGRVNFGSPKSILFRYEEQ